MLFTEFNLEDAKKVWYEEAFEDGISQGISKGIQKRNAEIAVSLFDVLDDETIAEKTGLSLTDIKRLKTTH
jgi:predicted transposase/invertase (TIGR01784 family)